MTWDTRGRMFYLLDTFRGRDERYISPEERAQGAMDRNDEELASGFGGAQAVLSTVERTHLHRRYSRGGPVPATETGNQGRGGRARNGERR